MNTLPHEKQGKPRHPGALYRFCDAAGVALLFSLLLLTPPAYARNSEPVAMTAYLVRPDDTLFDLADRYLLSYDDWRLLRKINHVPDPYRLPIQSRLLIPTARLKQTLLDARIVAVRGSVEQSSHGDDWLPLAAGDVLHEGNQVRTGRAAFVSMELPDGSHIVLPSNSVIDIRRLRMTLLTNALERRFELKQGEVSAEVIPMTKPSDSFQIVSPSVVAGVRGTHFRVNYQADSDSTTVEVLNGKVAVDAAGNGVSRNSEMLVAAGYGNVTRSGSLPGATVKLLSAPALVEPGKLQDTATVAFDLTPVDGAHAYRTEIATDAGFLDLVRDTDTSATHSAFENLPEGDYFVRVSAIDANGIDGLPQIYTFEHRQNQITVSTAPSLDNGYTFRWYIGRTQTPSRYRFILSRYADLHAPLIDLPNVGAGKISVSAMPPGQYYWTVVVDQFENGRLYSKASDVQSFNHSR